jgi:hypothetical protein
LSDLPKNKKKLLKPELGPTPAEVLGPTRAKFLNLKDYSLRRPSPSPSDVAREARIAEFRRCRRICVDRIATIESKLERGEIADALAAAQEFAKDVFCCVCAVYGVAPADAPAYETSALPAGKLRERLDELRRQLEAAQAASTDVDRIALLHAYADAAQEVLGTSRKVMRQLRAGEPQTALDRYKRNLILAALTLVGLVTITAGIVYLIHWMTAPHVAPRVTVLEATYGGNCAGQTAPDGSRYSIARGNMTASISKKCGPNDGVCPVVVDLSDFADPAPLCAKELVVTWRCSAGGRERRSSIPAEALGKSLTLSCR